VAKDDDPRGPLVCQTQGWGRDTAPTTYAATPGLDVRTSLANDS